MTFYYDHGTHWVTNDVLDPILTAPGSFQSELGCPGDWDAGLHAVVAAGPRRRRHVHVHDDADPGRVVRGQGDARPVVGRELRRRRRARTAPTSPFTVPGDGVAVRFTYDLATHVLTITTVRRGAGHRT